MKTIKQISMICITALFFSCGKNTKDLVANQWKAIDGTGLGYGTSGRVAQKYFELKYLTNNSTWVEKYKEFQTKLIEILKSRVFDLKEDGTFSMSSPGNPDVKGTWEYGLGSKFEAIDFTVDGKLFEIWKVDLHGGDDTGFKRLSKDLKNVYVISRYKNEEFKEIMDGSEFYVQLSLVPKNTEGFAVR